MNTATFHTDILHEESPQAQALAEYIDRFIQCDSCLDFGCSTGLYLDAIKDRCPSKEVYGFDQSATAVSMARHANIFQHDLAQAPLFILPAGRRLGICLEVLEHIEDGVAEQVLANIVQQCDLLIFTAALPGQGGVGHINCRPRLDWIKRFHQLGWVIDLDATEHLVKFMLQRRHMGWFVANVMVMVRAKEPSFSMSSFYKKY